MMLVAALQAAPDLSARLLEAFLSPAGLAAACAVVFTATALLWAKDARRKAQVAGGVRIAFAVVEEVKRTWPPDSKLLDKVDAGLKAADAWLVANNWRPLSSVEESRAKLEFKAIHGATLVAAQIAAVVVPVVTAAPLEPGKAAELGAPPPSVP